jgi:hypothetical protein
MVNMSGLAKLVFSSAIAGLLCYGYWKYRGVESRRDDLKRNEQAIEQVRNEVRDLETRLERTRERIKALENDPVEAEAAARRIGRTVRDKSETVFHIDESRMTPAAPAAPAPAAPEAPPAPPVSAPAPQQAPSPAKP